MKASRTVLGLGETTDMTAYDLVPADTRVNLVVSDPLRYGSCEAVGDSSPQSFPLIFELPVTITLTACGPVGVATVRLETLSGLELDSLSVTVQDTPPPFALDGIFRSATTTEASGQTPAPGASGSSHSPPPAPDLTITIIDQKDLLMAVNPLSGIGNYEIGVRARYSSSGSYGPWEPWGYATLPATWVSNNTAEDIRCGAYELKIRAIGDGAAYSAVWGPWSATVTAVIKCKPPAPSNGNNLWRLILLRGQFQRRWCHIPRRVGSGSVGRVHAPMPDSVDSHTNADSHSQADIHSYADSHSHADSHSQARAYSDPYAHTNRDIHTSADGHPDTDSHSYTDAYPD